jgi:hypothetical protein
MMRLYQWISGKELMERWQINPLGLVDIVIYERLPVYEPDGRIVEDIEYEYEYIKRAGHSDLFPLPPPPKKDNPSIYDLIFHPEVYGYKIPGPSVSIPPNYIPMADRIGQLMFKLIEVERFEKENNLILQDIEPRKEDKNSKNQLYKKEKRKNKIQIIREKVREKAIELWQNDPTITIADMFVNHEISEIAVRENGEIFVEKTIRDWIKDLCPDRSPGRRPETKPKQSKKGAKYLPNPDRSSGRPKGK